MINGSYFQIKYFFEGIVKICIFGLQELEEVEIEFEFLREECVVRGGDGGVLINILDLIYGKGMVSSSSYYVFVFCFFMKLKVKDIQNMMLVFILVVYFLQLINMLRCMLLKKLVNVDDFC